MKVFLSHSTAPEDGPLASRIKAIAAAYDTKILLPAREGKLPPISALHKSIKQADVVIALITEGALQSKWVKKELEVARADAKPVIILLERGLAKSDRDYFKAIEDLPVVEFDRADPIKHEVKLEKAIASIARDKKQQAVALLAVAVLLLSLLFLGALAAEPGET